MTPYTLFRRQRLLRRAATHGKILVFIIVVGDGWKWREGSIENGGRARSHGGGAHGIASGSDGEGVVSWLGTLGKLEGRVVLMVCEVVMGYLVGVWDYGFQSTVIGTVLKRDFVV